MKHLIVPLFALLFIGCFHDASPTGVNLLPGSDLTNVTTWDSHTDSSVVRIENARIRITAATSELLSVGASGGYEAQTLIRWLEFPYNIASGGKFISATLTFYPVSGRIGKAGDPFGFEAHEITKPWSSWTFTWDSLAALSHSSSIAASYNGPYADSIPIPVDTSLVRSWMLKSASAEYTKIYGLLLTPVPGSTVVQSMESSDPLTTGSNPKSPRLTIRMLWNGIDTTFKAASPEDTYVANMATGPGATEFAMHGGIAYRSYLIPTLSAIPPGSIINNVKLYLTLDSTHCEFNYTKKDTVLICELKDKSAGTLGTTYTITQTTGKPMLRLVEASFLVSLFQRWVNHPEQITGLAIRKANEISELDLLRFYGPDAAPELRPRFVITYTRAK